MGTLISRPISKTCLINISKFVIGLPVFLKNRWKQIRVGTYKSSNRLKFHYSHKFHSFKQRGSEKVPVRRSIDPNQFANIALARDHLLVVGNTRGKFNVMTVAWRALGELWHRPVAIVAVAPARYSFEFLTGDLKEFTLNVMPESMREEVASCGMISGRMVDKFQEFGLKTVPGTRVKVPTLEQADLCYECKIIHTADSGKLAPHTLFIGEIVAAFASAALYKKT